MTTEIRLLDKRTIERYLLQGAVEAADYERHIKSLHDVADKGEPSIIALEAMDED